MKRGHSNVQSEKTQPWNEIDAKVESGVACIPIMGGATPGGQKELPALSLRRCEWEEIGRKMGWLSS